MISRALFIAALVAGFALPAAATPPVDALPEAACADLRYNIEARLDTEVGLRMARANISSDQNKSHGLTGYRCWLWARMGGYAFPEAERISLARVADRLSTGFLAMGWAANDETKSWTADGPDGTVFARQRGRDTCVIRITFENLTGTGTKELKPHEQAYHLDISCFRPRW